MYRICNDDTCATDTLRGVAAGNKGGLAGSFAFHIAEDAPGAAMTNAACLHTNWCGSQVNLGFPQDNPALASSMRSVEPCATIQPPQRTPAQVLEHALSASLRKDKLLDNHEVAML